MDPAHLQELAKLEESYWWHVAKRSLAFGLVERFAKPNDLIIEGGVGAAGNLKQLQDKGFRVHGLDFQKGTAASSSSDSSTDSSATSMSRACL